MNIDIKKIRELLIDNEINNALLRLEKVSTKSDFIMKIDMFKTRNKNNEEKNILKLLTTEQYDVEKFNIVYDILKLLGNHFPNMKKDLLILHAKLPFLINREDQDDCFIDYLQLKSNNYLGVLMGKTEDKAQYYLEKKTYFLNKWINPNTTNEQSKPISKSLAVLKKTHCKKNALEKYLLNKFFKHLQTKKHEEIIKKLEIIHKSHLILNVEVNYNHIRHNPLAFINEYISFWNKFPNRSDGFVLINILVIEFPKPEWWQLSTFTNKAISKLNKMIENADSLKETMNDESKIFYNYPALGLITKEDIKSWVRSDDVKKIYPLIDKISNYFEDELTKSTPLSMKAFEEAVKEKIV